VRRREPIDPSRALGKRAQKGVVWSFLRESVSEILVFPASMVLGRLLTPAEFGVAAAAAFFTQMAARLTELGFTAALVRSKVVEPIHLSTVFLIQLLLGVACFALLVAASPFLGAFYSIPEPQTLFTVAALTFLISPLGAVPAAILQRNLEYQKNTTTDWAQLLAMSSTSLLFAWLGHGYMSIIYGRVASSVTQTTLRLYFARWTPSFRFSKAALREILPAGTGFFFKRLLDYSAQNGDNVVVGRVQGLAALGLYDKAYSTMNRFLGRMNTGGPGVMFRIFAVIHEEPERFKRAYTKVMLSSSMLSFPVFAALAVMAPQLLVVMFGPQWVPAAAPFSLLCVSACLKLMNTYASSATQAAGRVWSEVWRQLLYISLIVGSIIAFSDWGPAGAAAGVLLSTAVMSVLMHVLLKRVTHLAWGQMLRPIVPALICAAGVAVTVLGVEYALRLWQKTPNEWLLVACQAPAAALFVGAFALFAPLSDLRAVVLEMSETMVPKRIRLHPWAQGYLTASVETAGEAKS
jgi:O-antigen/teichoic acid export membrane protein